MPDEPVDVADPSALPPASTAAGPAASAPPAVEHDESTETPFDCFKRPNVHELLRNHPTTRPYSLDTGFLKTIDEVAKCEDQQKQSSLIMKDPRLVQAMGALQGWGLTVTEKEALKGYPAQFTKGVHPPERRRGA